MIKCLFKQIFENKQKVMFVFSHPDDAEIYAGGTIARLVAEGKEVRVVKMTLGNKGSRQEKITEHELMEIRKREDTASMQVLGIKPENNIYLLLNDGEVNNSMQTIEKLVKQIREFKPDLIVTHNPEDVFIRFNKNENWINHRDHRNTGLSVMDAAYPYSRDILFFPEHFSDEKLQSHTTVEYLLVDYYDHQDQIYIDITETLDAKVKALEQHSSQYSKEHAKSLSEYITKVESGRRYEMFRYVLAD